MLQDKVVVVSGGAGLLGREFCREVARQGGIAIVADREAAAAQAAASAIDQEFPARACAAQLDITDTASVDRLIDELKATRDRVDALVNTAYPRNRNYGRLLENVSYADFCENLAMHLGGYFLTAQRFGLLFRAQGSGSIVNMSSIYGSIAPRFALYEGTTMTMPVEYAAIKGGVVQMTKYLAQYFKKDGVRVNALSPGGILDNQPEAFVARYGEMSGRKGMLEPADLLGALVFLLSDGSRHVTGQNLVVDDGFSL